MRTTNEITDSPVDVCDQCGFDPVDWNRQDSATSLETIAPRAIHYIEGLDADQLAKRIRPDRWSIVECLHHLAESLRTIRSGLDLALDDPGRDFGTSPAPPDVGQEADLDAAGVPAGLDDAAADLSERLGSLATNEWSTEFVLDRTGRDVLWLAHYANHEAAHHLHGIGRLRTALEPPSRDRIGTVAQLNASDGGVPKSRIAVGEIEVTRRGAVGDRQASRRHHGRPWQALCLWRSETIAELEDEGHPIAAGRAGENVTIAGLAWTDLRAGRLVDIGEVRCEISAYAVPCAKNAPWFSDGDYRRILHERHPGSSRLYASVLRPGRIRDADPVIVEPTP